MEELINSDKPPEKVLNVPSWAVLLAICAVGVLVFLPMTFVSIGYGQVGVKFNRLDDGVIHTSTFDEGWHLKAPWIKVYKYNIKLEEYTRSGTPDEGAKEGEDQILAVTSEGLYVALDVTAHYKVLPSDASHLHQEVGPSYRAIAIRPIISSIIREVVSKYTAENIYGEKRKEVELAIADAVYPVLKERHLTLEKFLLRRVTLPELLAEAIEGKMTAEQQIQEQSFKIDVERMIADQRRVEASGIADAMEIINIELTPDYLSYLNIKALKDHNSVLYMPNIGQRGYPEYGPTAGNESYAPFTLVKDIDNHDILNDLEIANNTNINR